MHKLLITTALTAALAAATLATAHAQEKLYTGGETGDYYQYFGPPVAKLLNKALNPQFVDVTIATSPGTPATMDSLLDHPNSYGLAQGDNYATLSTDPKYTDHFKMLTIGIAQEAVMAVMNDATFNHSQGSWAAIAQHADRVHFIMPPQNSGPGRTFLQLQQLDPNGLSTAKNVTWAASMDDAIRQVAQENPGNAVTLMVQFANPKNARFQAIHGLGLHIEPVLTASMHDLKLPGGTPAYTFCSDVQVEEHTTINTACSPVLVITNAANKDLGVVSTMFASVTPHDFEPPQSAFAALWHKVKAASGKAWEDGVQAANKLAQKAADQM